MRHLLIGVSIVLVGPAIAGQMEEACLARGDWDGPTCACIQDVADERLTPETQELAAEFFAGRITSQQIAAQKGAAAAQSFLGDLAGFMEQSTAECGAP